MRKYLALVYNMLLFWLCWMLIMAFYYHAMFYKYLTEPIGILIFSFVVFLLLKAWHLIEKKAEVWDIYEYEDPPTE